MLYLRPSYVCCFYLYSDNRFQCETNSQSFYSSVYVQLSLQFLLCHFCSSS
uniref:Uncharacterized protein n=1 Tax=Manihot esculenta TaxID=3983 RepID=A0A2C9VUP3_MANES